MTTLTDRASDVQSNSTNGRSIVFTSLYIAHIDGGDGYPWQLRTGTGRIIDVFQSYHEALSVADFVALNGLDEDDEARAEDVNLADECSLDFGPEIDPDGPTEDDVTAYSAGLLYAEDEWHELVERAALESHYADLADAGLIGC